MWAREPFGGQRRGALDPAMGSSAQLNTAWNIKNSVTASSSVPHSGCSTTASMRSSCSRRCAGSRTPGP